MINFLIFCINYKLLIIYSKIWKIFIQNILILFNSFNQIEIFEYCFICRIIVYDWDWKLCDFKCVFDYD